MNIDKLSRWTWLYQCDSLSLFLPSGMSSLVLAETPEPAETVHIAPEYMHQAAKQILPRLILFKFRCEQ